MPIAKRVPLRGGFGANVNKLGDDVYWVRAPYNSFFMVFNDYVLVVEAPLNDLLSQQTIADIKKVAPGKPIRYLVVTHAHHDHIGGVRGFVAEGATIVTALGVRSEIERLVAEPHSLNPDSLSLHPASLTIETYSSDGSCQVLGKVKWFNNAKGLDLSVGTTAKPTCSSITRRFRKKGTRYSLKATP
jgi:Metallo-beta-lactamase superfamily